jgi:hypoxanthine phosphoribosyltransferase
LDVKDKVAIITDDGLASGYTMSVAVETVKKRESKQVIVAVPTGSSEALRMLHDKVDMIICLNNKNLGGGAGLVALATHKQTYTVLASSLLDSPRTTNVSIRVLPGLTPQPHPQRAPSAFLLLLPFLRFSSYL